MVKLIQYGNFKRNNMKESRKANELANKFISKSVFNMTDDELKKERELGKKYATICVDEILKNIEATIIYHKDSIALPINKDYWLDVRQQINLL
jgi:hypothetical protein